MKLLEIAEYFYLTSHEYTRYNNSEQQKELLTPVYTDIITDCSNYINDMKRCRLVPYCGSRENNIVKRTTPENRRSRNSDPIFSQKVDDILRKNGVVARRSNSIFVTSDRDFASAFGNLNIIIPFNTARFSWSPLKRDLILSPIMYSQWLINNYKRKPEYRAAFDLINSSVDEHEYLISLWKRLSAADYDKTVIILNQFDQILPRVAKLLGYREEIIKFFDVDEKELLNSLKFKTDDFASALRSEHEILIHGDYISMPYEIFYDMNRLFEMKIV